MENIKFMIHMTLDFSPAFLKAMGPFCISNPSVQAHSESQGGVSGYYSYITDEETVAQRG